MTRTCTFAALFASFALSSPAGAWNRKEATRFATLPPGTSHPEGITVDDDGDVYVADFEVERSSGPGHVVVFDHSGRLLRVLEVAGSSNALLGLDFQRTGRCARDLLVIDFGGQKVLCVNPRTGSSSVFAVIPGGAAAGPNALTFDSAGNVYVSDSFQGVIWQTGPDGGDVTPWASSPLLTTSGVPPFGANGIAFNRKQTALFVANTGSDQVLKIPVATRKTEIFVNSINGADGLIIDRDDNIWVAANQADEIVVVEPVNGQAIAKLGDFDGLSHDGAPVGLLFPASLVLHGEWLYVTNLSLDLRAFNKDFRAVDSQWAAQVKRHTVARISRQLPPVRGDHGD